ncbi:MAG: N-6 DNA methylase [Sulfurimonas sp.]|nr:N-6 DNA methylase [Sulfurimonas sp.]
MFQKSVLKNASQDESKVALRWAQYQKYLAKIDFIKTVKEEKYQDGFLKDIFENCLGYTLDSTNPSDFNLEREKKNETDGKKADAVIYVNEKVIGIIELKAQDTKNLDKIEIQAFNYHNSHTNSKYIIISNFDELRFYIDKKTAYEKFSLFSLDYEAFKKLHLLLSFESIKNDVPLKLKEKSATFEQDISKNLYRDFSHFRTHLFENLVKNNDLDKAKLLRLTQKLCDRIIFVLFAEDRGLLTANTIQEIRERHKADGFGDRSMYDYYKLYFDAINAGNQKLNIPKYNGGLFAQDAELDSLIIDDNILDLEAQALSDYDFMSDVSVNILGHIFEQSLTDLEEINASINEVAFDAKKSKRKKDGVFYTPEYITKYIVENTLGKLCEDKRDELNIGSETLVSPKNPKKPTKKEQIQKDNLEEYRVWLLNLKILDPACGSGAFLNQALDFLINAHQALQKDLVVMGDITAYYEIEKSILENNLYGVDINEDAVEIAKLSLWLRTASKGRELTKLADKILCANSLLDMPFNEGSFDVVIGNPPYVRHEMIKELKPLLQEKYEIFTGTADLFVYFYELGYKMLKPNGVKGFICSNKFFRAKYGEKLRELILSKMTIKEIVNFNSVKIFEDATVDSAITILKKEKSQQNSKFKVVNTDLINSYDMRQNDLSNFIFILLSLTELTIKNKVEKNKTLLKDMVSINRGITTGFNDAFIIDKVKKEELILQDKNSINIIKPILRGRNIKKYSYQFKDEYIITTYPSLKLNIDDYPAIKSYLESFGKKLYQTGETYTDENKTKIKTRKRTKHKWFEFQDPTAYYNDFNIAKIIFSKASKDQAFCYDNDLNAITLNTSYIAIGSDLKFLLSILNSKLGKYIFLNFLQSGGINGEITVQAIQKLPIPRLDKEEKQPLINFVDDILISKQKIKDYKTLLDEAISNDNFDREIKLKSEIESFEKIVVDSENEIDSMVYKLYELDDDEIKIVKSV